jgi:hypothetical protein
MTPNQYWETLSPQFTLQKTSIKGNPARWVLYNCMFDADLCRKMVELIDNEKFSKYPKLQAIHEAIVGTYRQGEAANIMAVMQYIRANKLDVSAYELVTLANAEDVSNWIGISEKFNNKTITQLM